MIKEIENAFNTYGKKRYELEEYNGRFIKLETVIAFSNFEAGYLASTKQSEGNPMLLACKCTNEYQDKKYGKSNRVHNISTHQTTKKLTCTVCGSEKTTTLIPKGLK